MKRFSDLEPIIDEEGNELPIEETITEEDNVFFDNGISSDFTDGQRLLLRLALNQLTDQQKKVVQKRFFEGKTEEKIAQDLGMIQQAVNQHLNAALKKIRKICLGK